MDDRRPQKFTDEKGENEKGVAGSVGLAVVGRTRRDVKVEIGRPRVADRYSTLAFSRFLSPIPGVRRRRRDAHVPAYLKSSQSPGTGIISANSIPDAAVSRAAAGEGGVVRYRSFRVAAAQIHFYQRGSTSVSI